jgi:hypothetical protein
MTIFQRAATFAAMTCALVGLAGISTPGLAAEPGQTSAIRLTPAVLVQSATNPGAPLVDPAIPSSDIVTAQAAPAEPAAFETLQSVAGAVCRRAACTRLGRTRNHRRVRHPGAGRPPRDAATCPFCERRHGSVEVQTIPRARVIATRRAFLARLDA